MRWFVVSALFLAVSGCSDAPGPADGPPADLVPSNTLVAIRIANPEALDREIQELGALPAPPTAGLLPIVGVASAEGVDQSRPWYLFLAEDAENREMPMALLPLSDPGSFQEALEAGPPGSAHRLEGDYVLMGRGDLPDLGNSSLSLGFTGDIDVRADLSAIQAAYAEQIEQAKGMFQETMGMGLQEDEAPPGLPGFEASDWGDMVEAQSEMMFGVLEQSEEMGLVLDLDEGQLSWSLEWALESGSPWGEMVSNQRPEAPSGLGRVDLHRPMVAWMSFDMGDDQDLLRPFFQAIAGMMEGIDPEVFLQLAGQKVEGVMSMGWDEDGMAVEAAYTVPDMEVSEYRDLVREQMSGMGESLPGVGMEYRESIGQVEGMEVDVLVQEIEGLEGEEIPMNLQRTEVYYGWGDEEFFMVMTAGGDEGGGLARLEALATRDSGPVPTEVQAYLDLFPRELLMLTWVDVGAMVEGFASMAPESPEIPRLSQGIPPMLFYATADGSSVTYGGTMDLGAMASSVSGDSGR